MDNLIIIENNVPILNSEVSERIAHFERQIKRMKQAEDELKEAILEEMEKRGIIQIDTDDIMISYVHESERESFNTRKFKAEFPETYEMYAYTSPVKSSIRIKVKE